MIGVRPNNAEINSSELHTETKDMSSTLLPASRVLLNEDDKVSVPPKIRAITQLGFSLLRRIEL